MPNSFPLALYALQKETIGDLIIINVQLSHAGIYMCSAQTVVDSAVASARLVVRGECMCVCVYMCEVSRPKPMPVLHCFIIC